MSEDTGNEYFSEGLSEELLNLLVRIPELKVAARTSSFSYKGKDTKIAQIGEELKVAHVLEGSVRKSGNQLRITAQLIKADDGYHVWSQTYDRTLDDIFQIQDDIASSVVDALKVTLLGAVPEVAETDPEVYSLYLQGKFFMTPPASDEDLEKAVSIFKKALAIGPEYAPAWLGLSWAYEYQRFAASNRTWEEQVALTKDAAAKGLALDENMALAWSTTSFLLKKYDWDWDGAIAAADKALELEPNNFEVLLGTGSVATTLGQLDKAIELYERAVAVNPLALDGLLSLALRYRYRGRYEEALETYKQSLVLFPENIWAQRSTVAVYLHQRDPERALAEIDKLPDNVITSTLKAEILLTLGEEAESRALVSEFLSTPKQDSPYPKALIYAWQGENDSAFESLELAFEMRHSGLTNILVDPRLTRLKNDPRYLVLVEKMGLLPFWEAMQ
jgi:TolB-like protein